MLVEALISANDHVLLPGTNGPVRMSEAISDMVCEYLLECLSMCLCVSVCGVCVAAWHQWPCACGVCLSVYVCVSCVCLPVFVSLCIFTDARRKHTQC